MKTLKKIALLTLFAIGIILVRHYIIHDLNSFSMNVKGFLGGVFLAVPIYFLIKEPLT